ncbi:Golgi integral membrane protein 4a isoform X4 [Leucoraja erinacea]|uniref:Golgi integral membrane protein 4a isoform X4 n=1 Tax=Leucoraja erinaceus TaxID=7782 RepID=UPI002454AF34|nr:Golgi integral membrane protein 4a isoform X4 [Leucoraja erinacea]
MGSSMCSRRQKKIFQTLFFLTIVFGFLYGLLLYYEMHSQLKKSENLAFKYQQHQEALSAQLQVVYEHRSRLEKSLQKERNEHKKAKEDYLVYKLEAQESLNKEKQDSNSRFSALSVQHKMLKSQHEDLRKQYTDLHGEHVQLGEDHGHAMNQHNRQYLNLQQSKEQEIAKLKENIYNLFEENKKLRRAHQDVHVQLQDVRQLHKNLLVQHDQLQVTLEDHKNSLSVAQAQVEEYKQLRETLNKMPSLRQGEQKVPSFNEHEPHPGGADPITYQERQGEHGQVPYRADDKEREGEPSHVKPIVEEDDAPETRGGGGGEEVGRQHAQHENWHRNPQPAETEGEQTEEEGRDHREWEQEDKDHTVEQRDTHRQPDEEEDAESHPPDDQDVGNDHTEERDQPTNSPSETKHKSPYEEQLEQQHLAELREEEARRLKERQDALHQQRLREYMDRQQRLQQEEKRKEELARQEQFRRQADFHHDGAAAETEDEHDVREEEEEEVDEENNPHEEAEDQDPEIVNEQHQTEHEALKQQKT